MLKESEIYALVIKGTVDIQGLVAISNTPKVNAMYITWMCSSPENNRHIAEEVKYLGVGGHLFAIAVQKSIDYGYNGYVYGFASNEKLLSHYIKTLNAKIIGTLHPYHFAIDEKNAKKIVEVYEYEWTDEEI